VRQSLDRIEKLNPQLRAFNSVYADRSLELAGEVDAGRRSGALAGAPIAIKDNICAEPYRARFLLCGPIRGERSGALSHGDAINARELHDCADGGAGVADLQGYKIVETERAQKTHNTKGGAK
jgi:hypothetical protein